MESTSYTPIKLTEETNKLWERTPQQKVNQALGGIALIALSIIFLAGLGGIVTGWTYSFLVVKDLWMFVTPFCPAACLGVSAGFVNFLGLGVFFLWTCRESHHFPQALEQDVKDQIAKALQEKSFETVKSCIEPYMENHCLVYNGLLTEDESTQLQEKIANHNFISSSVFNFRRTALNRVAPPQQVIEAKEALEKIETWWEGTNLLIFN